MLPSTNALTTDLRSVYRASEARAARLRLLIQVSRDLAATGEAGLDAALNLAAHRAALFAGFAEGALRRQDDASPPDAMLIPLDALSARGETGRRLEFRSRLNAEALDSEEDAEALRLLIEMIEARLIIALEQRNREDLLARLAQRERQLEEVLSEVVRGQELERRAISADLHDGVAQQIAALHRRLELLQLDLPADAQARLSEEVGGLIDIARLTVSDLRRLIAGLRPTALDDLGVVAALREEARRLEAGGHTVAIRTRNMQRLPDWLETLIFRVGQEGLNNAAKHAAGSAVELDLIVDEAAGAMILTIDSAGGHGRGAETPSGTRFGLEIMRERLAAVAGRLEAGPLGDGFRIRAVVPVTGT